MSSWPTCASQDCTGIQLPGQEFCLAHVDEAARAAFLAGLRPGSDLDLRGTPISPDLFAAVFDALEEEETPKLGSARFDGVQFSGGAEFSRAEFSAVAWFDGAQFSGDAWFAGAQFSQGAWFAGAQFGGDARFSGALFGGIGWFAGAWFAGAWFAGAQFSGVAWFDGAQFSDATIFDRAQFSAARELGPLLVENELTLRQASFSAPILIEVATLQLSLVGVAFQEAASLRVRFAEIALDGSSFTKPSTISCAETAFQTHSGSQLKEDALETGNRGARPRLLSLRLVDVSNLVLGNLDLSACLFQGAHNLEKLRIEGPPGSA